MLDVESLQGPIDTSTPNQVDEPMHDAHAEIGLGQGPNAEPLQERFLTSLEKAVAREVGQRGRWRLPQH